jgi:hypothetical protein
MSATRFFLHLDDPVFEPFGGIYIPYNTEEEALAQAANDLFYFGDDAEALGLKGIFKAEYGSHQRVSLDDEEATKLASAAGPNWGYDYNQPFGHLNPDERQAIHSPSDIVKQAVTYQKQIQQAAEESAVAWLRHVDGQVRRGMPPAENAVPGNAYTVMTGGVSAAGAVALVAATAKTVILLTSGTANQPSIVEWSVSFDGTTATAIPVLVEAVSSTAAGAGTGTAQTPKQIRGWPAQASQSTAAYGFSAEPTVLEVYKKRLLTPNGGVIIQQQPMGREHTGQITAATQFKALGFRLTAPAAVNCHADMEYEE